MSGSTDVKFEEALERLNQTVKKLESGELSLEDSIKTFEEGTQLSKLCQEKLAAAEQRVEILVKSSSGGEPEFQGFGSQK